MMGWDVFLRRQVWGGRRTLQKLESLFFLLKKIVISKEISAKLVQVGSYWNINNLMGFSLGGGSPKFLRRLFFKRWGSSYHGGWSKVQSLGGEVFQQVPKWRQLYRTLSRPGNVNFEVNIHADELSFFTPLDLIQDMFKGTFQNIPWTFGKFVTYRIPNTQCMVYVPTCGYLFKWQM